MARWRKVRYGKELPHHFHSSPTTAAMTHRTTPPVSFSSVRRRELVAEFSAGHITSDAGLLILREADRRIGRNRERAAAWVASSRLAPCSRYCLANSTIKMAFLQANPTSPDILPHLLGVEWRVGGRFGMGRSYHTTSLPRRPPPR